MFEEFSELCRCLLSDSGRVFFTDEGPHELWKEDFLDQENKVVRRTLQDGTAHRAVKVFWEHRALEARLATLGWAISVHSTGSFYWGEGHPSRS